MAEEKITMTNEMALQIFEKVSGDYKGTRKDHVLIVEAIKHLKSVLNPIQPKDEREISDD